MSDYRMPDAEFAGHVQRLLTLRDSDLPADWLDIVRRARQRFIYADHVALYLCETLMLSNCKKYLR